jgi:hypothetical protein
MVVETRCLCYQDCVLKDFMSLMLFLLCWSFFVYTDD